MLLFHRMIRPPALAILSGDEVVARSWGGAGERGDAGQERETKVGTDFVGNANSFEPALRKLHALVKARRKPNRKLLKINDVVRLVVFQAGK